MYAQQGTAKGVLKRFLSSGLFLTIAILYSIVFLYTFITALVPIDYDAVFNELNYHIGVDVEEFIEEFDVDISIIEGAAVGGKIGGCILPGLTCIGLWMLFISAKFAKAGDVKTGGFQVLKVVSIVNGIVIFLVILLGVFAVTGLLVVASDDGEYITGDYIYSFDDVDFIITLCIILYCVLAAVAVFAVVLLYKELITLTSAAGVAKTGAFNKKPSLFLMVVFFIGTVVCIVPGAFFLSRDIIAALIILSNAAICFLSAIGLLGYRTELKQVSQNTGMGQQLYSVNYQTLGT